MTNQPTIKRVYQRNVPITLPELPPPQHGSILEELEAIDNAIDHQSCPTSSKPPSSSSSKSIQPSLSLGQNNEPPSSSMPLTPNDPYSPIHSSRPISYPQQTLETVSKPSNQQPSPHQIVLSNHPPHILSDHILPNLSESFDPLPVNSEHAHPPSDSSDQQQAVPLKNPKSTRRILDSDDDDVQENSINEPKQKSRKFKKLKGLTKKDQEEAQRVIAACKRQKSVRLAASCRKPLTRLGDIITKATRSIESFSKQSDNPTHLKSRMRDPMSFEQTENTGEHHETNRNSTDPVQGLSSKDDDLLPNIDELMTTSDNQPCLQPSKSHVDSAFDQEEALKKKEWLKNQRKTTLEPAPSTDREEQVEIIDSDSDLDIVQGPVKQGDPRGHLANVPTDPFEQRLNKNRSHSKSITSQPLSLAKKSSLGSIPNPFASTMLKSITETKVKKLDKIHQDGLMQDLLAKSAIEGALIREQKRNEFIERGGRLATAIHAVPRSSEIQEGDVKSILKNGQQELIGQNRNVDEEDEEEDIECDWDEVASSTDEIELSGEEEVEYAEANDDELEDSQEEKVDDDDKDDLEDLNDINDTTIRPVGGSNDLKTLQLPRDSPTYRQLPILKPLQNISKCFSSESLSNDSAQPIRAALPLDYNSTILAPDSNSTEQNSSRTSSKPSASDSSEPDHQPVNPSDFHSRSSSPIHLPGFNLDPTSRLSMEDISSIDHSNQLPDLTNHQPCSPSSSSDNNSDSLPGFKHVKRSKMERLGNSKADRFSELEGESDFRAKQGGNNSEVHEDTNQESNFSQLFQEEQGRGINFTHPPPLLKSKIQNLKDDEDQQVDHDNEISATCILPAVEILPEERERDLVVMVLGAQKSAMEDDDQPIEYVNHRGFLTQHKPVDEPSGPPDSPLMSQDPISRTPFALRKGKNRAVEQDSARHFERDEGNSPTQAQINGRQESMSRQVHSPVPSITESAVPIIENAFTRITKAQKLQSPTLPPPPRPPSGKGRIFLAEEADESEDEYERLGRRLSGDEDEEALGSETEEAKEMLKELVDDGEDDRDEKSKLEGDLALKNLAKHHRDQLDQKFTDQIHKIVNGKFRVQKARGNRAGVGAISDSDSEDDAEFETLVANKRAQAFNAKKKKKAIDLLANKHESFFKSYQEGTNQWVDEDELMYLQQPEDQGNQGSQNDDVDSEDEMQDDEDDEDNQEGLPDDVMEIESKAYLKEKDQNKFKATMSSSPPINSNISSLPFKINDRFSLLSSTTNLSKNPNPPKNHQQYQQSSKFDHNAHLDLDKMYDGLNSIKDSISEQRRRLVIEELGPGEGRGSETEKSRGIMQEGRKKSGNHNHMNNNKSSSITYQQQQHRKLESMKAHSKLVPSGSNSLRPTDPTSSRNRLSKLKNKK